MKAFLDIETSGFSMTKNGLCEIALIAVDEQLNVVDTFHSLIKPYKREGSDELVSYKDESMAVNGLTIEELEKYGTEIVDAMCNTAEFIKKHKINTIIGHNSIIFDIPWTNYLLGKFSPITLAGMNQEDTMRIAKQKLNLPSYSLQNLLAYFGIENNSSHRALGDAAATHQLYKKLIQI